LIFDWDEANIEHLARHEISPVEAEQVLDGFIVELFVEQHPIDGIRIRVIGQTSRERILIMVITWRGEAVRAITGFDAPRAAKQRYIKRRLEEHHG
jgi:uncharacterized DUF497 family protein